MWYLPAREVGGASHRVWKQHCCRTRSPILLSNEWVLLKGQSLRQRLSLTFHIHGVEPHWSWSSGLFRLVSLWTLENNVQCTVKLATFTRRKRRQRRIILYSTYCIIMYGWKESMQPCEQTLNCENIRSIAFCCCFRWIYQTLPWLWGSYSRRILSEEGKERSSSCVYTCAMLCKVQSLCLHMIFSQRKTEVGLHSTFTVTQYS